MHTALASDGSDPAFAPEEPSQESTSLITATIDEQIERLFVDLPSDNAALEPIVHRGEEVRDRLSLLSHIGSGGRLIRHHGDLHLGQTLLAGGRESKWIVLDFEGEPARPLLERRRKRSPLRDVAGMLRSFAYAASAAELQRGTTAPEGWEDRTREAFLAGYFGAVDRSLLPPGRGERAHAADHLRAREGGLRTALRAQQPPRLGADPGGRDRATAGGAAAMTVDTDIDAIVHRDLAEPHRLLGAHAENGGVVIRTFRPDAAKVIARPEGGEPVELELRHPGGVFEGKVPGAKLPLRYELEVELLRGRDVHAARPVRVPADARRDRPVPRRRGPPRGALREARRARARDRRRARASRSPCGRRRRGRSASSATSTRGTAGCTRCARSARRGIWELFVPDVAEGSRYKYEIRAQDGSLLLRADPYAFAAEVPPQTASVVHRPRHEWRDQAWMTSTASTARRCASRSRSTRSTSAPGGATRSRATAR